MKMSLDHYHTLEQKEQEAHTIRITRYTKRRKKGSLGDSHFGHFRITSFCENVQ